MISYDTAVFYRAIFSDETESYRTPSEPVTGDEVTVRLRLAKDSGAEAFLCWEEGELPMELCREAGKFSWYEARVTAGKERFSYQFRICFQDQVFYYHKLGLTSQPSAEGAFSFTPGFSVPDWAKGAAMYQIFVERFCNGDPENDVTDGEYSYVEGIPVKQVKDWNMLPAALDVGCFYGGDLEGVRKKLDYLQYLGVECIYFNPLFVSPSNHKYDSQDYDHIDPHFGRIVKDADPLREEAEGCSEKYRIRTTDPANLEASDALFARLCEEIHSRGMRLILDGVFNHCGSFHKWMDREGFYADREGYETGAYWSKESPYHDFFSFEKNVWPENDSYEGWWDYDTLPKLNYEESEALREEILRIAEKWVSPPYRADGWRLDVAADLGHSEVFNHEFWRTFRKRVKAANPEALILAEHYGDPRPWLQGDQWDSVMNYDGFMEPVSYFLTGMEKHSDAFEPNLYGNGPSFFRNMDRAMATFQGGSLAAAMNELSNHDHSRFLTRTNRTVGRTEILGPWVANENVSLPMLRLGAMIQFTWPGAPTVYYGDETGVCGWTDPDSRRTYPWGREDWELIEYHRYLYEMHRKNPVLRKGSLKALVAEHGLIAYGRFLEEDAAVVIINQSEYWREARVPVWELGLPEQVVLERIMVTNDRGYNVGRLDLKAEGGWLNLPVDPHCGIVLRRKK